MRETCHEAPDEPGLHDEPLFKLANTGIFAMARTIGWIAQWNEMISGR